MKALGMESDEQIFKAIVSDPQMANIVYANIEECQNKKLYPPNGIYTTEDEILFLERCLALMKPGGRMGIVLPEGIFNNPSCNSFIFCYG